MAAILPRVARDADAMCGTTRQLEQRQERVVRRHRLGVRDVERCRGDDPVAQRGGQRDLVDDRTARGVDEDGRRLHPGKRGRPDEVPGLRRQVDVEGHEVGPRQELVHVHGLDAQGALLLERRRVGVVDQDGHVEATGSLGHLASDAAEADDADRGVVDVGAEQEQRAPGPPLAGPDVVVALRQAPGGGHQERPGEVGGRLGQDAGRVADGDAAARAGRHVDVVEADGEVADDPQAGTRGVEQLVVDPIGEQREEPVHAAHPLQQRGTRWRQLVRPEVDLERPGQRRQALLGQAAGDEDAGTLADHQARTERRPVTRRASWPGPRPCARARAGGWPGSWRS